MPGKSKCPFGAESHCETVSLKGLLHGKASKLVEEQHSRGLTLNQETLHPDWTERTSDVIEKLRYARPPQSGAGVMNLL